MGKATVMLKDAGLQIKPLPLKILKSILEGASVEDRNSWGITMCERP
jgi:hypothetical protein